LKNYKSPFILIVRIFLISHCSVGSFMGGGNLKDLNIRT
jgi:hypothetical protein